MYNNWSINGHCWFILQKNDFNMNKATVWWCTNEVQSNLNENLTEKKRKQSMSAYFPLFVTRLQAKQMIQKQGRASHSKHTNQGEIPTMYAL